MRVLNKKYWPHQYKILPEVDPQEQMIRLERLCYDNFKSGNWRNYGLYFCFKKSEDASWFLLNIK